MFELLDSKDREKLSEIRKATEQKRSTLQDRFQSSAPPSHLPVSKVRADVQLLVSKAKADVQLQISKAQAEVQLQAPDLHQQALSVWSSPTAQTSQTFKPFEKNPSKQARYESFISQLKQGNKSKGPSVLKPRC